MNRATTSPLMPPRDFSKRAERRLAELQPALLPEHAVEVIAINVDTGEYLLAPDSGTAWQEFRNRWPGTLGFVCRVDGGPVVKFHGM